MLGVALAISAQKEISVYLNLNILFCALCLQIAVNLFNDVLDAKSGMDTEDRLGPTRVTSSGLLTSKQVFYAGLFFCFIAFVLGVPLIVKGGWPIALIGLSGILLAYIYTGTKFSLSRNGTADIFVVLFFGVLPTWGTTHLNQLNLDYKPIFLGLALGLMANALLVINNLRDYDQDLAHNKKTLIVRLGKKRGQSFLGVLYFLSFSVFAIFGLMEGSFYYSALLFIPWAYGIYRFVCKKEASVKYNKLLKSAGQLQFLIALVLSLFLCVRSFMASV